MENQSKHLASFKCLCEECPNFHECLAMAQKIFSTTTPISESGSPASFPPLLKEIERIVKGDPVDFVCCYGGLFLGATFAEWLKKNFVPRKVRKRARY